MTDSIDEESIVRGLRNGAPDAWTAMYDKYSVELWRYVSKLTGANQSGVADVVQETFVAAAQNIHQFDEAKGKLPYWLYGIAHNKLRNAISKQQQHFHTIQKHLNSDQWQHFWTDADASAALETTELVDCVRTLLAELPSEYAGILYDKYIAELSLIEIEQRLGITSDAVRSKLKRARQAFRKLFERTDHQS